MDIPSGMQLKAVVFDWDLTLWNSWDIHMSLMQQTASDLGYPHPNAADLAKEYSRPFLEHLAWFFPGDQEKVVDTYMAIITPPFGRSVGCIRASRTCCRGSRTTATAPEYYPTSARSLASQNSSTQNWEMLSTVRCFSRKAWPRSLTRPVCRI